MKPLTGRFFDMHRVPMPVQFKERNPHAYITCPRCHMTSYHPNDVREGYCGNCHDWTSDGE